MKFNEGIFNSIIREIDRALSKQGVELNSRPIRAATIIAEHYIVSVDGKSVEKDKFYDEAWFAGIYRDVHAWFEGKYGDLNYSNEDGRHALLMHAGIFRVVLIPKTIVKRKSDKTIEITFPDHLHEGEDYLSWISPKIDAAKISNSEANRLNIRVASLCKKIRSIAIFSNYAQGNEKEMVRSVPDHLEQAALVAGKRKNKSLAIWELHLAVEKCLKFLIYQSGANYPKTHDLTDLCRLLIGSKELAFFKLVENIPGAKEVIDHRYMKAKIVSDLEFYGKYKTVLKICMEAGSLFKRDYVLNNASFVLGKPPWFSQMDIKDSSKE